MAARHIIALLKSHVQGDSAHFLSVAMQVAAEEARRGHGKTAETIRELVDAAKRRSNQLEQRSGSVVVLQPRGELASLVSVCTPDIRLSSLVLPTRTEIKLKRVLQEQRQQSRLRQHNLRPRRKLLFIGPARNRQDSNGNCPRGRTPHSASHDLAGRRHNEIHG